jgi:hypothetical protein
MSVCCTSVGEKRGTYHRSESSHTPSTAR